LKTATAVTAKVM